MEAKEARVKEILEDIIAQSSYFLIDLFVRPNLEIQVFLDGDKGIDVNAIAKINRALYKRIEEDGLFEPGSYALEVSSAGLSQPLKLWRQYKNNIGRTVKVSLHNNHKKMTGLLKEVEEAHIVLEYEEGKKKKDKITKTLIIPFDEIKETIVQVVF